MIKELAILNLAICGLNYLKKGIDNLRTPREIREWSKSDSNKDYLWWELESSAKTSNMGEAYTNNKAVLKEMSKTKSRVLYIEFILHILPIINIFVLYKSIGTVTNRKNRYKNFQENKVEVEKFARQNHQL